MQSIHDRIGVDLSAEQAAVLLGNLYGNLPYGGGLQRDTYGATYDAWYAPGGGGNPGGSGSGSGGSGSGSGGGSGVIDPPQQAQ